MPGEPGGLDARQSPGPYVSLTYNSNEVIQMVMSWAMLCEEPCAEKHCSTFDSLQIRPMLFRQPVRSVSYSVRTPLCQAREDLPLEV